MPAPLLGEEWFELTASELPIGDIYQWAVRPDCGAVVLFSGTVRDHADGRTDVTSLDYEAYEDAVIPSFAKIANEARVRFVDARRIAILHRTGKLSLGNHRLLWLYLPRIVRSRLMRHVFLLMH